MGMSPTERSRLHRERKRATQAPDKVATTARVPSPEPKPVSKPVSAEILEDVRQLRVEVALLRAIDQRVTAIENAVEALLAKPQPPNPLETLKAHPLIRGAMLRPCCPSTTAEPHAPDCLVSPAP